jgi:hypothetical protein
MKHKMDHPMRFTNENALIVILVPKLLRMMPDRTHDDAPPRDNIDATHAYSLMDISYPDPGCENLNSVGADHPREIPYRKLPPEAENSKKKKKKFTHV